MFFEMDDISSGTGPDLGASDSESVSFKQVARVKSAAALVSKRIMLQRQADIARKLGLPASTIGFVASNGMGHILSTVQAVTEGEGPWYNPGATHNEQHASGVWPDMTQYLPYVIEDIKRLNGMSQYEVEHMGSTLLAALAAKAKAGQRVIAPSPQGPPPDPIDAANQSLSESTAGRAVLAAGAAYDAGVSVFKAPFAIFEWLKDNKLKLMIGGGVAGAGLLALIVWPYISAARAGGKAIQRGIERL